MLWNGWSNYLYNCIFPFFSLWAGINPFLFATGVVILQCCIIITMLSVLPPHLTLQMEISLMEFPLHIECKMTKCSWIFPKQIMTVYFSHPSLQPISCRMQYLAQFFFTSFINYPLMIWSHSQQKEL